MDIVTLTMIAGIAGVLIFSLVGYFVFAPAMGQRSTVKQRIESVSGNGPLVNPASKGESRRADRRRDIQSKLRGIEDTKKSEKVPISVRYKRDLERAGFNISLRTYFMFNAILAVIAALAYIFMGYPKIGILPVAIAVGFGLPRFVVKSKNKRRIKAFTLEFANALDVIIRGIRSGLPVGECLRIIATESPEPVSGIFREIVEAQNIGMTLTQALDRAVERMDTADLKFFAIVLAIQSQTGGNLADTLQNLSNILRERKKMADKVRALSSEAKSSASIIGSLPFLIFLALYFVNNDYVMMLFREDLGNMMVMGGLIWMTMGILVMRQMINFEI
jgi:tight adherence protein B